MSDVYRQNLEVIGQNLDDKETVAATLLDECFPDETTELITWFERIYQTDPSGTLAARRAEVIAAIRNRGGLTETYLEGLGNALGGGVFTVDIQASAGNLPFVVHTYSPNTSPQGPATVLPGALYNPPFTVHPHLLEVIVTGSAGPETALEILFERIKPAWIDFYYTYVP